MAAHRSNGFVVLFVMNAVSYLVYVLVLVLVLAVRREVRREPAAGGCQGVLGDRAFARLACANVPSV